MKQVQAWELLNNPDYCGRLDTAAFYDLLLRAGYSEEVAQRAAVERANQRLDAEVMM